MKLLNALPGAVSQGVIWGIMAIGVYITYRILDVADLTVDGSIATGGAVAAVLIISGCNAWVALVAAFSCLWTISELTGGGEPMRQYVHDATVLKLPGRAMIAAVAAVLCILGQAIYCILHSGGTVGVLLAFFLLESAGAAAMVLLFRCIRGANWQLEK